MKNPRIVAAISAGFIACSTGFSQPWYGEYKPQLGTLPSEQGWTFSNAGGSPAPEVIAGALHQGLTSFNGSQYWHRQDVLMDFNTLTGVALELRLKVISSTYGPGGAPDTWRSGFQIYMTDVLKRVVVLGVTSTGVRLSSAGNAANNASTPLIELDTTSTYRTYTLTASSCLRDTAVR
jgi:hypothetical protein